MRSAAKQWFTPEVKRAGWISAVACMIAAVLYLWLGSVARASSLAIVYAMLPSGLGCLAVGTLNLRRWHSLRESMGACVAAVVNVYKIIGTILLLGLLIFMTYGWAFLYFAVVLTVWFLFVVYYLAMVFVVVALVACAAGASLYGLLLLMRYVGELGRTETHREDERPRALRMVV